MSVNIYRRDLGVEERQNALIKLIARTPEKSDRQIAKEICVDHKTIARARAKGEATGAVAPVEKRVGGDGKARKQPTRNRETKKEEEERFKRRAAETRAQMAEGRAAHEFGKNEQLQARIDDLTSKNSALKAELAKTKDELAKVKAELDEIIAAQVDDGARNARGNRSRVAGRQRRARRQCQ